MYVYLTSGDVLAVPSISDLELSDQSIRLRDCNGVTVEYPRSAVYFMSRVLDAPPSMF